MNVELLYEPLPKQALFHSSPARFRCYAGGFGSGKTKCGAAEVIKLALKYPNNLGLVGRMTYPELRDTTRKELLEFPVGVDGVETTLVNSPLVSNWNKSENCLTFSNGTQVLFRALEDAFHKIKSLNLGFYWIDEATEANDEIWLGLSGRLRRPKVRRCGFATTNPEGHDWLWKTFVMNPDKDHFLVTAPSTENSFLPEGYIEDLVKRYPQEWVKRYVYGSFDTFEGLIYKEFEDKSPWVLEKLEIPDEWYRFIGIDHGYRNPTAVLWGAVSPKGNVFIYDELYVAGKLVSEIAEIIKTKNGSQKIQLYLIDPSCANRDGKTGRSVIDEFADYGIYCQPANNDVRAGLNRVQEYIKLQNSLPKLQILRRCSDLRTELQTYRWKDIKPGAKQDAPERPLKKGDHAVDALRYMVNYLYDTPVRKPLKKDYDYKKMMRSIKDEVLDWMAA